MSPLNRRGFLGTFGVFLAPLVGSRPLSFPAPPLPGKPVPTIPVPGPGYDGPRQFTPKQPVFGCGIMNPCVVADKE